MILVIIFLTACGSVKSGQSCNINEQTSPEILNTDIPIKTTIG